ncbi:asparaginase [Clostridium tarantellae]|uniref:Asparaginase n=1 Tax=Clostridium tarantellae TaxID=39493 RepID=A0A6I1MH17_9CLOT|nr:asparaginase [Clostridium tarantellae]MPQ42460.1 asparaginase [Clostridium tarantellae]
MKKIAIIFNGGTISMKVDERIKAAVPSLTGEEIMAMVTGIENYAKVESHNFSSLPSPHMTPKIMLNLSKFINALIDRDDIDGVVVTHGTDTLEETAYLVSLTINTQKSIVFTGAMRSSSELGYDGPSNLAASICTATAEESKGRGVLICFNGELNSATEVTKANSMALNAFKTPSFGPIGIVDNNKVIFYRNAMKEDYIPVEKIDKKVAIIKCAAGMDSDFLNYCIESGYDGIVIEALGRGNIPPKMVNGVQSAIKKGIIIVITSRCFEGRVFDSYGYEGGGKQLRDLGVILGENLPSQKARIKLLTLLCFNKDIRYIKHSFEKDRYK